MSLIKTPHAAVIVWNYNERLSVEGLTVYTEGTKETDINEVIISTVSLISISTTKSKSNPVGSFNLVLAPTRNWTAVLTPGSWCAILMSNEPIDKKAIEKANVASLKMIGRIDAVRTNVSVDENGTRSTSYSVHGRDWGQIFENSIYVDPIVQDPSGLGATQANALYQQIVANVYDLNDSPNALAVPKNLYSILSILGQPLRLPETDRLAKSTHEVSLPEKTVNFLHGTWSTTYHYATKTTTTTKFMEMLSLVWGALTTDKEDEYDQSSPEQTGLGWLNPGSLVGQHSVWSILQDNCNYAMNELFTEIRWKEDTPEFRLYCRIKPFAYTNEPASRNLIDVSMRSKFQNIKSHLLDKEAVVGVHAGINWADKFNFLEIKPDLNELDLLGVTLKDKSQAFQGDNSGSEIFNREGFRPMFFSIRQLPFNTKATNRPLDTSLLQKWVHLAKEWYFDSHKLLNGTVTLYGSSEYIPVGDNIMFDAELVNVTDNHSADSVGEKEPIFVLAHVESVQNEFTVGSDGARSFRTTINFVRGIFVNEQKQLIGTGTIDKLASYLDKKYSKNNATVHAPEED